MRFFPPCDWCARGWCCTLALVPSCARARAQAANGGIDPAAPLGGRAIECVCLSPLLHHPVTAGRSLRSLLMAAAAAWNSAHDSSAAPTDLRPWHATGCWWTREFPLSLLLAEFLSGSLEIAAKLLVTVCTPQGRSFPHPLCFPSAFLLIRLRWWRPRARIHNHRFCFYKQIGKCKCAIGACRREYFKWNGKRLRVINKKVCISLAGLPSAGAAFKLAVGAAECSGGGGLTLDVLKGVGKGKK